MNKEEAINKLKEIRKENQEDIAIVEEYVNKLKEIRKENQEDIAIVEEYVNTGEEEEIVEAIDIVLNELKYYTDLIKSAKQYVEENSHEFMCERDGGLPELEFYDNTNASDLLGILDGNF